MRWPKLKERFERAYKVEASGCWIWKQAISRNGYGRIGLNYKNLYAHRVSYELNIGAIPNKLSVLHKCDNRKCVNPEHLFLGTQKDNIQDMIKKQRGCNGEKQGNSKLTAADVKCIRESYWVSSNKRNSNLKELSEKFGISKPHICALIKGIRWKHLLDNEIGA